MVTFYFIDHAVAAGGYFFIQLLYVCVEMAAVSNCNVTAAMLPTDNEEIHGAVYDIMCSLLISFMPGKTK
jgi:hypothetical protein